MISEAEAGKYVAEYFEKMLKRQFEAGDKSVLLYAIYACLELKRPVPEWLRVAFLDACEAAERFEIRSWDEVFGRPVPKGMHLKSEKRNAELRVFIIQRVEALKAGGKRVDKGLFEQVGKELGISGTVASDIYYNARSRELRKMISGNF
jgi:hypothetical protein